MLVIAALQVGDHAFEPSLRVGGGRLDVREVAAELRTVRAIQQEVALNRCVILDGFGRVELEAVIFARVLQDLAVVVDVEFDPTVHRIFRDALAFVDQAAHDGLSHHTQARAGGAGSRRFVEREVGHAHLWHVCTAMRTGVYPIGAFVGIVLPIVGRRIINGRRNILSTLGAGAMTEAGVQNSEIGKDFGNRPYRRTGTVIRQVLIHADGWRQADDGVHRRLAQTPRDQAE